ncbi:hypothetical protein [Rhodocyclus tenuis]|uniref:hypothetical protein n=1 Tax=Rhodocyclus tenuis TaxID=1066 RepID=UPI0019063C6C|nr:hypothetical protein [Rhodocyclus tenuis]
MKPQANPQDQSTASAPTPARTAREARADGRRNEAEQGRSDAPPSNTASDNCKLPYFKALRWGVDSLYLSYPGDLFPEVEAQLKHLKQLAQANEPAQQAEAQYAIGAHIFEVKDKGAALFPYILEDGAFRIQLSRRGKRAPMAYVKIAATYLAHVGPTAAEEALRDLLGQLGELHESANVSRIDLFVDFASSESMESWGREAWVTRAASINTYAVKGVFSGWAIGLGGVVACRLYNKLLEIVTSGKDYLLGL